MLILFSIPGLTLNRKSGSPTVRQSDSPTGNEFPASKLKSSEEDLRTTLRLTHEWSETVFLMRILGYSAQIW